MAQPPSRPTSPLADEFEGLADVCSEEQRGRLPTPPGVHSLFVDDLVAVLREFGELHQMVAHVAIDRLIHLGNIAAHREPADRLALTSAFAACNGFEALARIMLVRAKDQRTRARGCRALGLLAEGDLVEGSDEWLRAKAAEEETARNNRKTEEVLGGSFHLLTKLCLSPSPSGVSFREKNETAF